MDPDLYQVINCFLLIKRLAGPQGFVSLFIAPVCVILILSYYSGGSNVKYRTVRGTATGEYEEKSRFIAQLSLADSEEAAVAFLEQVRAANRTARHNVYAYVLREGGRNRYSDDGEPAKPPVPPCWKPSAMRGFRM